MLAVWRRGGEAIPVYGTTHLTTSLMASRGVSEGHPPIFDRSFFKSSKDLVLFSEKRSSLQMSGHLDWIHNYRAIKGVDPFLLSS